MTHHGSHSPSQPHPPPPPRPQQQQQSQSQHHLDYDIFWPEGPPLGISLHQGEQASALPYIRRLTGQGASAHLGPECIGDLLMAVNGRSIQSVPFLELMNQLQSMKKPIRLHFRPSSKAQRFSESPQAARAGQQLRSQRSSHPQSSRPVNSEPPPPHVVQQRNQRGNHHHHVPMKMQPQEQLQGLGQQQQRSSRYVQRPASESARLRPPPPYAGVNHPHPHPATQYQEEEEEEEAPPQYHTVMNHNNNITPQQQAARAEEVAKFSELHTPFLGQQKLSTRRNQRIVQNAQNAPTGLQKK